MQDRLLPIKCIGAAAGLLTVADESVDSCITTVPPFDPVRGVPQAYTAWLGEIFESVRRTLVPRGTLWVNIGDSFAQCNNRHGEWKRKDLLGLPWMLAFELRRRGWYLRQEIIWHRLNCVPESVKDRCTRSHEHIFMFSKQAKYTYYRDAIREFGKTEKWRNRRDVWVVDKDGKDKGAGLAPQVIATMLRATTKPGDMVLDPFAGEGIIPLVAHKLNRAYTAFEGDRQKCTRANQCLENENLIIPER